MGMPVSLVVFKARSLSCRQWPFSISGAVNVYALIDRWSPRKLEMDMRAIVFLDVIGPKEYGLF